MFDRCLQRAAKAVPIQVSAFRDPSSARATALKIEVTIQRAASAAVQSSAVRSVDPVRATAGRRALWARAPKEPRGRRMNVAYCLACSWLQRARATILNTSRRPGQTRVRTLWCHCGLTSGPRYAAFCLQSPRFSPGLEGPPKGGGVARVRSYRSPGLRPDPPKGFALWTPTRELRPLDPDFTGVVAR